jgi:hypothetical protein
MRSTFSMRLMRMPLALTVIVCVGCHHRPLADEIAKVPLPPGTVLVLPPRNVIQDGKPHRAGADSGTYFARSLAHEFTDRGWRVVSPTAEARFTNTSVPSADAAIAEARNVNADYVFRTVLGEFRDAAPMTFRPDFVTLDSAHLWQTKNAALVWSLERPMEANSNNLRHYYHLLDELADDVVSKLTDAEVALDVLQAPPRNVVDPLGSSLPVGPPTCTTDQILAMKNSGLSDDQIRRACDQE